MRNFKLIFSFLFFINTTYSFAGIKEDVAKCVVRVRSVNKYSTGFFWKNGTTIITTLHSLSNVNEIEIFIPSLGLWKRASLQKVYKSADLILLKIDNFSFQYFLSDKYYSKPSTDTKAFTIGYNAGNSSYMDRDFSVGLSQGTSLKDILPSASQEEIKKLQFPSLSTQITYLKGSLLHGFSGSPIVDMQGKLIGVADGGLENGAAGISWCVNASHINNLENSSEPFPILNQTRINTLFAYEDYQNKDAENNVVIELGNFKFQKIKTRTFSQLDLTGKYSNADAMGLSQLLSLFSMYNYKSFEYDIYMESTTGATIVIPADNELQLKDGLLVAGNKKIKYYVTLNKTSNIQQTSENFEKKIMPNYATNWVSDPYWTYLTPYYGVNNSVIRRRAYFGNFNRDYLFEALTGNSSSFLGVAAKKNNSLIQSINDLEEWAKYAIAIQLSTYSN